ncbi:MULTISPECIES: helix-turn-helix domain-containing protein [unclassified Variovorax]|uniref:helix-turn-helix domain-containing protein n=1 Tax=unclassified Variovorax TaxID=663243 RepID=UPI000A8927DA|nr:MULTISPECIES: helix-turn-helix domain-containing protein [unclassified Variovorax]PNG46560.1 hypothetical protein CHC06_06903 [Variovorax sp. B2]PNG47618.1 hypothetical protein CHC07_06784 [Variovorax sp. B4]VTV14326.1 hypothetical protein WDL1CHR_04876 [Variovorax sp. WDL1]
MTKKVNLGAMSVASEVPEESYQLPPNSTSKSTATEVQIQKLIAFLRQRPRHTHELRMLGISHPAGRVLDLQERGYVLESARVASVDSDGFTHRGVALYSLIAEPEGVGR